MLGFYSIRKLVEATKLSDDVANQNLRVTAYSWKGKAVTRLNKSEYWELYDLEHARVVTRSLAFLCHQIVHSYIFVVSFDQSKCLDGILITSDRERQKMLYKIQVKQIIELFEQVGADYPDEMILNFNSQIQDYKVQSRTKSRAQKVQPKKRPSV